MSLNLQEGLPFPKGIINIISDYSHTLFYIDELKDKTKPIYNTIRLYEDFDLSYFYTSFLIYNTRSMITSGISYTVNSVRRKLFDRENERRLSFGLKENYNLFPRGYNRCYQSY